MGWFCREEEEVEPLSFRKAAHAQKLKPLAALSSPEWQISARGILIFQPAR